MTALVEDEPTDSGAEGGDVGGCGGATWLICSWLAKFVAKFTRVRAVTLRSVGLVVSATPAVGTRSKVPLPA